MERLIFFPETGNVVFELMDVGFEIVAFADEDVLLVLDELSLVLAESAGKG